MTFNMSSSEPLHLLHGYTLAALDIDIFIETTTDNAKRTLRALKDNGYDVTDVSVEEVGYEETPHSPISLRDGYSSICFRCFIRRDLAQPYSRNDRLYTSVFRRSQRADYNEGNCGSTEGSRSSQGAAETQRAPIWIAITIFIEQRHPLRSASNKVIHSSLSSDDPSTARTDCRAGESC